MVDELIIELTKLINHVITLPLELIFKMSEYLLAANNTIYITQLAQLQGLDPVPRWI
jgi:hypothetical protein